MRRFNVLFLAAALTGPALAEDLTIVSWGGAYEAAQRRALFDPFAAETGIDIVTEQYDGSAAALKGRGQTQGWDVIDMLADQARIACAKGLLLELDAATLVGFDALDDFSPAAPMRCAIPQNVYGRVFAYDERAFPGVKPTRIEHFFDVDRFPGKRAVQRSPDGLLEWALLAEGVPPEQVYGLLSTDRGLRLVLRRLEAIRDHIVWWTDPAEPAQMLADRRATIAAGFNGRFFDAIEQGLAPINIVWDGRIIGIEVWAIAASSDAPEQSRAFLAHALTPDAMARLSELIPYGPARRSAFERIGQNPETGAPMRAYLPNAPRHGNRMLVRDSAWYANTEELRQRRFDDWLKADE